jgi:predicted RecB family nuclease
MFSATQIASFVACPHTASLDRAEARHEIAKPFFNDSSIELLQKLGLEHERRYLRELETQHLKVIRVSGGGPWEHAASDTLRALRNGADAVYQGALLRGNWGGRPDFVIRVDGLSDFGAWKYEVIETKLAHSTKANAVMQLCFYSELLGYLQGIEPERMHVVLGGGASPEHLRVQSYAAFFRKVKNEFEQAWQVEPETYPEPNDHCNVCSWATVCDAQWRKDDHLSLVAGISRNQRKALKERGVTTVVALAELALHPEPKIQIGKAALERIREQARIQVEGRQKNRLLFELLRDVEDGNGLSALPAPSAGDLFLDFEGGPYVLEQGLEYLLGVVKVPMDADTRPVYEAQWAFTQAEEKKTFESFMAMVMTRWREHPDMHIYHYAPYEPSAIKRLVGRYGVCVGEVDQLLRAGVFVDLYRIVRQSIRASVESYSIKRLEPLYEFKRAVPLSEAKFALQSFEAAMALGNNQREISSLLQTIEGYNRDDCVSLVWLQNWLEERRKELEAVVGRALPRPRPQLGEESKELSAHLKEVHALTDRLLSSLPNDNTQWTNKHRAHWLLAQLLEWHRREEKSSWWEYFRLCGLTDAELQEDRSALGGLVLVGEVGREKRSITYRYGFPPQDHALDRAIEILDPRTGKSAGHIETIDERNWMIDLRRGRSSRAPHPTALIPFEIVGSTVLRDSIFRISSYVADHGIDGSGNFEVARNLLLREPPAALRNFSGTLIGDDGKLTASARVLVHSLPRTASVLPIQGPPGSGKTFTGARMIMELVKSGRRAGITAFSHKAISTLLREVCRVASDNDVKLSAVQKGNGRDEYEHTCVLKADSNEDVLHALAIGSANVAAGSAWLWAREDMTKAVDVLFVDEAAQMSLANVLAMSSGATSIVLLGDPQQLEQPKKGLHPPGADLSALGYLLNGQATISAEQGIFISETRRLHPDVCVFTSEVFYEGRLIPRPENANQRINTGDPLGTTGLRFIPVKHSGNQNESPEEVEKVVDCVNELLRNGTTWTDQDGMTRPLTLEDILVVAPYNAQVAALVENLPKGTRVGTVDKFQGQEAAIVFYSMATSTPDDAPRGMEFLYSLNRLNVAVSRARCVAIIVASPSLLQVQCRTPRQIELANAFCRYLELAQVI